MWAHINLSEGVGGAQWFREKSKYSDECDRTAAAASRTNASGSAL